MNCFPKLIASFLLTSPLLATPSQEITHLEIQGLSTGLETAQKALEEQFSGKELSKETLLQLREATIRYFEQQGLFGITVSFPKQSIKSGTVTLEIELPTLSHFILLGNSWNTDAFYEKKLSLVQGAPLNTQTLCNQVAWMNRNPFRYAELVVSPGLAHQTMDLEVLIKDRIPFRPFFGADNTGTNLINQARIYTGFNLGNLFGGSDLLTYQYSTAPEANTFYAHTLNYLSFLPWKHELNVYGGYSVAEPDLPGFYQKGITVQASIRYQIPFQPLFTQKQQTLSFGFDYKNMNTNVFYIDSPEDPVITHQVNLSQFYVGYAWKEALSIKAELYYSPFRLLPHESKKRYNDLRPHSRAEYAYAKLALANVHSLYKGASFAWTLRGQASTGALLPSEQFGLGGYDTVRGYEERDFVADQALCINLETRSPPLSFFKKDELLFLAFTDFGTGYNYQSEQHDQKSQTLWSAGVGTRYQIGSWVDIRADYGFQLHHILDQHAFGRFHLGASLSY